MSEHIEIEQNGILGVFDIDIMQIEKLNGGRSMWEFTDESPTVQLKIGENGEWTPDDFNAKTISEVEVTEQISGVVVTQVPDKAENDGHNLVISEGENAIRLSGVKKLRVNRHSGGTVDMVPRSNTHYGTLYVTEFGKYSAKEQNYAGYSNVNVNVNAWTDLPDEIKITVLPTKTSGKIDYSTMEVRAYKNGSIWENELYKDGIIPNSELNINQMIDVPGNVRNVIQEYFGSYSLCAISNNSFNLLYNTHWSVERAFLEDGYINDRYSVNADNDVFYCTMGMDNNGSLEYGFIMFSKTSFKVTYVDYENIRLSFSEEAKNVPYIMQYGLNQNGDASYDWTENAREGEYYGRKFFYRARKFPGSYARQYVNNVVQSTLYYSPGEGDIDTYDYTPSETNKLVKPLDASSYWYVAFAVLYGNNARIDVEWKRPRDNVILKTFAYIEWRE